MIVDDVELKIWEFMKRKKRAAWGVGAMLPVAEAYACTYPFLCLFTVPVTCYSCHPRPFY